MNTQQVSDLRLLYNAVYDENLREQSEEYNNTIFDEDIVEVATEYFYTYGLNEDGIDILIEKVGLDNFVEFVYSLSEDLTVLTEARAAKKRTGGKSYEEVKAEIDRKEAAKKAAKKKASEAAQERTETEKKEPESKGADTEAKAQQPKKRPIRDAIARQVLAGMERHRKAMELARETGKTVAKAAAVTHEAGRRAGEHVKKHGLKSLANEEFDNFDVILEHLVAEGYADTNQAALAIMANMSEEWKQSIVEGGVGFTIPSRIDDFNNRRDELKNRYKQDVSPRIPGPGGGGQYGEPPATKATGVRLARGTSSSNRGKENKA
jgi:hypothetical protein